jgi:hypothetical protein
MQVGYGLNYYGTDYGDPNGTLSLSSLLSVLRIKASNLLPIQKITVSALSQTERIIAPDLLVTERVKLDTFKSV